MNRGPVHSVDELSWAKRAVTVEAIALAFSFASVNAEMELNRSRRS